MTSISSKNGNVQEIYDNHNTNNKKEKNNTFQINKINSENNIMEETSANSNLTIKENDQVIDNNCINTDNKQEKNELPTINTSITNNQNKEITKDSDSSVNLEINKDEDIIFQQINNFINYPKYTDINIIEKVNQENKDFYSEANTIFLLVQLNTKVNDLKNILRNSILDINNLSQKIEIESNLQILSITNLRL